MIMQNKFHSISGLSGGTPFSSECSFLASFHSSINLLDFSQRYVPDNSKPILVRFLQNGINSIIDCSMFRACTIVSIDQAPRVSNEKGFVSRIYVVAGNSNFSISVQQRCFLIIPKSFPKFFDEKSSLQFDMRCFNPYKRYTANELVAAYNRDRDNQGFVSIGMAYKLLLNEAFLHTNLSLLSNSEIVALMNKKIELKDLSGERLDWIEITEAIEYELDKRKIDYRCLVSYTVFSLSHVVLLKDQRLYTFSQLTKKEANDLFQNYMKSTHPEKMKLNPTLIEYNDDTICFGMFKYHGRLRLSTKTLISMKMI